VIQEISTCLPKERCKLIGLEKEKELERARIKMTTLLIINLIQMSITTDHKKLNMYYLCRMNSHINLTLKQGLQLSQKNLRVAVIIMEKFEKAHLTGLV